MINKKNYVEHLLHLALTLSLLRVDPESYQDLHWETRLAGTGVGGWQLELRAAPLTDQTYINRKALPPIIEDLARFDTQYNVPTHFDLQAYLLNIQNSNSSNQTSSTRASSPAPVPVQETPNSTSSVVVEPLVLPTFEFYDIEDVFLSSDPFPDSTSILEQNIADLNDFGEAPINTYALDSIPLKNEPPPMFEDLIRMPFEPSFFPNEALQDHHQARREEREEASSSHECCQTCDARKARDASVKVKEEPLGEHDRDGQQQQQLKMEFGAGCAQVKLEPSDELMAVKKEEEDGDEERKVPVVVELTQEVRFIRITHTHLYT